MSRPPAVLAQASEPGVGDYIRNLFTGALEGDMLSLFVVGAVALILIRLLFARWVFVLAKQSLLFGGLTYVVWFGSRWVRDTYGEPLGLITLATGAFVVAVLFGAMLYNYLHPGGGRERVQEATREQKQAKASEARSGGATTTTRVGAGALQGQNLAVHQTRERKEAAGSPATASGAAPHPDSAFEEVMQRLNLLGATRDQNLLTVMVLILVAQFGVFTSKTIDPPSAKVGMVMAAIFVFAAVVFVKTTYSNYLRGVVHFVFATIFATVLSIVMLIFYDQTYCPPENVALNLTSGCTEMAPITLSVALDPMFYFDSTGIIAAITGVAFSTLLTKSG